MTLAQSIPVVEDGVPSGHADEKDNASEDGERKEPVDGQVASTGPIPWRYRVGALAFIIFITSGIEFAESTLGPLKHTLVTEMGVTSKLQVYCIDIRLMLRCAIWGHHDIDQPGQHRTSNSWWYRDGLLRCWIVGIAMLTSYLLLNFSAALVASSFGAIGIIITASVSLHLTDKHSS
jgi:hypothetical protein